MEDKCHGLCAYRPEEEQKDAQPLHVCPYKSEIHEDDETLCDCCEDCAQECAYDI